MEIAKQLAAGNPKATSDLLAMACTCKKNCDIAIEQLLNAAIHDQPLLPCWASTVGACDVAVKALKAGTNPNTALLLKMATEDYFDEGSEPELQLPGSDLDRFGGWWHMLLIYHSSEETKI